MYTGNLIGGRYRLTRRIGAGNMGVVFEVEDQQTGRRVALKQVLYGSKEHQQRLLREARVCQRLKHPNIIEVLDVGVTDTGAPFLVMPLLTGETIAELLKRKRRVAPMLVAEVGRDIANALAAAHAEGIIHRDLKPANVFIHRPGKAEKPLIKVLDFGVCKEVNSRLTVLTSAGNVVGTPAYMSPEQLKGVELDPRTDVWSLGVVLFEMLTGVRPFRGEGVELFLKILSGEIPMVSQLVRSVPSALADIVARCLARDREARIGSAEELAAQLDEVARGDAPVSTAPSMSEHAGSTSSGMATHLGSQTVSGPLIAEAGAALVPAASLAEAAQPEAKERAGAPLPVHRYAGEKEINPGWMQGGSSVGPGQARTGDTLVSAPGGASQSVEVSVDSAEWRGIAAGGPGGAEGGFGLPSGDHYPSADRTNLFAVGGDGPSSFEGLEQPADGMALDGEVMDGVPRRVLLAIGAAALVFALLGVGLYAAVTGGPEQAVARAAELPTFEVPSMGLSAPAEAELNTLSKEDEPPASAPLPPVSTAKARAAALAPKAQPHAQAVAASPRASQPNASRTSAPVKGAASTSRAPAVAPAVSTNKLQSSQKLGAPAKGAQMPAAAQKAKQAAATPKIVVDR